MNLFATLSFCVCFVLALSTQVSGQQCYISPTLTYPMTNGSVCARYQYQCSFGPGSQMCSPAQQAAGAYIWVYTMVTPSACSYLSAISPNAMCCNTTLCNSPLPTCQTCVYDMLAASWDMYNNWDTMCSDLPAGTNVASQLSSYYSEICYIPNINLGALPWQNSNCPAFVPPVTSMLPSIMTCPPPPLDAYGNNPWMGLYPVMGSSFNGWCAQAGFC